MWSKKIWIEKPVINIQNYNVGTTKSIEFADQEAYEAWLKQDGRVKIGWLATYLANHDVKSLSPSSIKLIIGYQKDLDDLAYSYAGAPKYFLLVDLTKEYNLAYESEAIYRAFTDEEMLWARDNVVIQDHLKDCIRWCDSAFE